ncbi:hypothetical protein FXO37_26309 [Capsicum annuum]|nr:hypothetical protein FXO37_26309 [Capsicum annuum]
MDRVQSLPVHQKVWLHPLPRPFRNHNEQSFSNSSGINQSPTALCNTTCSPLASALNLDRESYPGPCNIIYHGYQRSGDTGHSTKSKLLSPANLERDEKSNRILCESNKALQCNELISEINYSSIYPNHAVILESPASPQSVSEHERNCSNPIFHSTGSS